MGKQRMKCPHCGNENVNDMLVEFEWDTRQGSKDTTTLPKFLHYLRYPNDIGRMGGRFMTEPSDGKPVQIIRIYCDKYNLDLARKGIMKQKEIKPTRFGV